MATKKHLRFENVAVAIAATVVICVFGGASRVDVLSQIVVQCTAAALIAFAWFHRASAAPLPKTPMWILAAMLAIVAVQLIPLPPALWQNLPGRALFAQIDAAAGLAGTWRPISLVPDSTLSALLGLVVPVSAGAAFALTPRAQWHYLALALLSLILMSAILGLLQVSAPSSGLYFYKVTNIGSPVGFFANRNHQAIFLALAPILLVTILRGWDTRFAQHVLFRPALFSVFLLCLVAALVNGSRIGLIAFLFSVLGASALNWSLQQSTPRRDGRNQRRERRLARLKLGLGLGSILITAGVAFLTSRSLESVSRFSETSLTSEGRLKLIGPLLDIAGTYFPWGTGFGSFPEVYKIHEPDAGLTLSYLNHAHNDLVEILIEGGVASLGLAAAALIFAILAAYRSWRSWGTAFTRRALYARGSSLMLIVLLIGSATDYPLRTPALGFIAGLSMFWLWSFQHSDTAAD